MPKFWISTYVLNCPCGIGPYPDHTKAFDAGQELIERPGSTAEIVEQDKCPGDRYLGTSEDAVKTVENWRGWTHTAPRAA